MRKSKDCGNCIRADGSCLGMSTRKGRRLDKRQLRKLKRTASSYGAWERYYCKKHKYEK